MNNQSLIQLLKKIKWPKKLIILAIIISSMSSSIGLLIPLYTGKFVDGFSGDVLNGKFISIFAAIFLLSSLLGGLGIYLLSMVGESFIYSIRSTLSEHVIQLPLSFFDNNESGDVISRITDDTNIVNGFLSEKLPTIVPSFISLTGSLIMLLFLDWKTTIATLILIPLMFLIMTPLSKIVKKVSFNNQYEMAKFTGNLNRSLSEIRLVKTAGTEDHEASRMSGNLNTLFYLGLKKAKVFSVIQPISGLIIIFTIGTILGFGGVRVSEGSITIGILISMIFYVMQLTGPLTTLSSILTEYQEANGASTRISEILDIKKEEFSTGLNEVPKNTIKDTYSSSIKFKNVDFSYSQTTVLSNVSFDIPINKTTAIVGPSGSGKTTLLNLLERLYPINNGDITIDDISIYRFPLKFWRGQIGYVIQNNTLMTGSVKENILYGLNENISDERLIYYSELSNCYEFIINLENKFNTEVGERGAKLSTGQSQRINIARNLIKEPKILLLDEATSSLDSESEQAVQYALDSLLGTLTTVIVAHRLATIKRADNIVFIEDGKITGQGTHEELMISHEKYNHFVTLQNPLTSAHIV